MADEIPQWHGRSVCNEYAEWNAQADSKKDSTAALRVKNPQR